MPSPLVISQQRARAFHRYTDLRQVITGVIDVPPGSTSASVSRAATAAASITATATGGSVALLTNNCESGQASGTAVTTSNSDTGTGNTGFTAVSPVTAGAITYTSTNPYKGGLAIATVQANSANACTFEWTDPTPASTIAVRCYILLNSYPSATCQGPINIRSAASGALGRLNMTSTGQLSMTLGSNNVSSGTSSGTLDLGTWYRIEVTGTAFNTSATTLHTNVYLGDSSTAISALTLDIPAGSAAVTAALANLVRFGRNNAAGSNDWVFDDLALNVGTSTQIGPSASGNAGDPQTVEPGTSVPLVGTGTGTWSQVSGTTVTLTGSGNNRSFIAPASLTQTDLVFGFGGSQTTVTVQAATESVNRGGSRVPALMYVAS